jgi:hypothetical protein
VDQGTLQGAVWRKSRMAYFKPVEFFNLTILVFGTWNLIFCYAVWQRQELPAGS